MKTMFKIALLCFVFQATQIHAQELPSPSRNTNVSYELYQVTMIESVVPAGLGRSRMLTRDERGRQDEVKLENFFSAVGINFSNIQANESVLGMKMQTLSDDGWELYSTAGGVYSADTSTGIFITRYIFRRPKK
jgi:hypothetical protein